MPVQEKRDYYEILCVAHNADSETLKKAYRAVAMATHPDRNPGDMAKEAIFKEASEAYAVLRDDDRRTIYDTFGHSDILTASVKAMTVRLEALLRATKAANQSFEEMLATAREINRRLQETEKSLAEAEQRSQSILDKATGMAERSDDMLHSAKKLYERIVNSKPISR